MEHNVALLRSYFARLGLDAQLADLYHALQTQGPQTISDLARSSGIDRIRIYRLLDGIKASGLIEVETRYKRSVLHAAPLNKIQILIAKKEQELKDLQRDYPQVALTFAGQTMQSSTTRVQFYEGLDGIKQMIWGQTKSKSENLVILYDNMQNKTNLAFFERWVRACNERNVRFRGIIGDHFIQTQQSWYGKHSNERLQNWESRYIPESEFPLTYSLVTYDDVVMHYNWHGEKIFGVEMHNAEIARMQRQFFEMLWQRAAPVDDLKGVAAHQSESPAA